MARTSFSGPVASANGFIGTGTTTLDALSVTGNTTVGGTVTVTGVSTFTGNATFNGNATLNGNNVIGNATTDTVAFYGVTPTAQQNTTGTATGFTAGTGTPVLELSTFTGGVGTRAYNISDIVRALKTLGLIASS